MSRFFAQIRRFRVSEHQNYQAVCSAGVRFVTNTTPDLDRAITEAAMTAETTSGSRPDGLSFYPDQFIPVFEKNGFCVDLDFYMVDQARRTLRRWLDEGRDVIPIMVRGVPSRWKISAAATPR